MSATNKYESFRSVYWRQLAAMVTERFLLITVPILIYTNPDAINLLATFAITQFVSVFVAGLSSRFTNSFARRPVFVLLAVLTLLSIGPVHEPIIVITLAALVTTFMRLDAIAAVVSTKALNQTDIDAITSHIPLATVLVGIIVPILTALCIGFAGYYVGVVVIFAAAIALGILIPIVAGSNPNSAVEKKRIIKPIDSERWGLFHLLFLLALMMSSAIYSTLLLPVIVERLAMNNETLGLLFGAQALGMFISSRLPWPNIPLHLIALAIALLQGIYILNDTFAGYAVGSIVLGVLFYRLFSMTMQMFIVNSSKRLVTKYAGLRTVATSLGGIVGSFIGVAALQVVTLKTAMLLAPILLLAAVVPLHKLQLILAPNESADSKHEAFKNEL